MRNAQAKEKPLLRGAAFGYVWGSLWLPVCNRQGPLVPGCGAEVAARQRTVLASATVDRGGRKPFGPARGIGEARGRRRREVGCVAERGRHGHSKSIAPCVGAGDVFHGPLARSEEHTSELQSLR